MATSNCSLNSIYAKSGGHNWSDASYFYIGKSGGYYYRTKVVITTPAYVGNASYIIVKITIDGNSSPVGTVGCLTTKGSIATGKVMSDDMTGLHSDVTTGSLATSYAYSNKACTTLESGTDKKSGYTVYYKFSSSSIKPSTTYYAYFCYKSGRGSTSGWTQSTESNMWAKVGYTPRYTLTLTKGTGVSTFTQASANALQGNTIATSATAADGYYLDYYSGTLHDGSGTTTWDITDGTRSHSNSWTMNANRSVTLYAARNAGTVYYYANGGTSKSGYSQDSSGKSTTTSSVNSGSTAANLYNVTTLFQRTGYHVYNNDADATAWRYGSATSTTYFNQASQNFSSYLATEHNKAFNLYANWEPNVLTVIYNANGGTQGSGSSYTLPHTTTGNYENYNGGTLYNAIETFKLQKTGYHLDSEREWYTSTGVVMGDDTTYTPAQMATNDGKNLGTGAATINVYANWQPNTYTVTYNANGGSGSMSSSTATYQQSFITRQCTFTRANYRFKGWNEKTDGTGTWWYLTSEGVYESGKSWTWTYTQNITLYAQWELTTVYVYVYKDITDYWEGKEPIDTLSGNAGSTITLPNYNWQPYYYIDDMYDLLYWHHINADDTSWSAQRDLCTWTGFYDHDAGGYNYPSSFTLPTHNLYLAPVYSRSNNSTITFQAPSQCINQPNTKMLKCWTNRDGITVKPGSWIEIPSQAFTLDFYPEFEDVLWNDILYKNNNKFKYSSAVAKINNEYINVHSLVVKYNDEWISLYEYLKQGGRLSDLQI